MQNRLFKISLAAMLFLCLLQVSLEGQSEILWSNTYGGAEDEAFQDIHITSENNAQVIGFGQSTAGALRSNNGLYDMLVSEINSNGAIDGFRSIGGSQNDFGKSILIHQDRTFIGGLSYSMDKDISRNLGGGDILFGNLNEEFQLTASTLLGGNNLDNIVSLKMMRDGSIIIVANTNSTDVNQIGVGGATDIYVCRLLPEGIVLWETTFGSNRVDKASDVAINNDDNIIIVGSTFSDNFLEYKKGTKDGFVMCVDNNGNQLWGQRFGNGNYASFIACDVDSNNNILIAGVQGQLNSNNSGINGIYNEDIMVLKLDETGEEVWRQTHGGQENEIATDILSTLDGGILVIGATNSFDGIVKVNFGDRDAFALKLNRDGQTEWSEGYGGSQDEVLTSVAQDEFGHYWMVGQTTSSDIHLLENHGGIDAWILKIKGTIPSLTVNLGASIIVCEGEEVRIDARVNNCECEYSWSDGFEGAVREFTANQSTTLSVTVVDEAGNIASDEVNIRVNKKPVFELLAENPSCFDSENGQITAFLISDNEPASYTWSTGSDTATDVLFNLGAGEYSLLLTDENDCTSVQSTSLLSPEPLDITANITDALCENLEGEILVEVTGGTTPYSYEWSNGETTNPLEGIGAGDYRITISDRNDCTLTTNYTINREEVDFELEFDITNNSCAGLGEASISVLNGADISEYEWSTGSSNSSISNLSAGEYTLNYITKDGCSGFQTFVVNEPEALEAETLVINNDCSEGREGSISLLISGGTPPYIMAWSTGEDIPSIDNLPAGIYSVTINDDNGCAFIIEEEVEAPNSIVLEDANIVNQVCEDGDGGVISVDISGGTGSLEYLWSNGANTPSIENLAPGGYQLTVVDQLNCTQVFDFTLNDVEELAEVNIAQADPSCFGEANGFVSLSSLGDIDYIWPDGFIGNERDNLQSGDYEITVGNSAGCTDIISISLDEPAELDMSFFLKEVSCFGLSDGALQVNITGGIAPYTAQVENSASNIFGLSEDQILEDIPAGLYFIEIEDANGCVLGLPIVIQEPDPINIEGDVINVSCFGEMDGQISTIVTGGTGDFEYFWGGEMNTSTIENLSGGIFQIEVTDENNCQETKIFQVEEPTLLEVFPSIEIPSSSNDDGSISLVLTGGVPPYTVNWADGEKEPLISGLGTGTYEYTVTDATDCSITGNVILETTNSIRNQKELEEVSVFPNPSDQVLFIQSDINYSNLQLELHNTLGQQVYQQHFGQFSKGTHDVPVHQLSSGIYYLSLSNDTNRSIYKIVVEHP